MYVGLVMDRPPSCASAITRAGASDIWGW